MSDEYISKADIINIPLPDKAERNYITYNHDDTYEQGYQEALDKAASMPPADVAHVVHGRWIDADFCGQYECSECGNNAVDLYDYCPFCGAIMDAHGEE